LLVDNEAPAAPVGLGSLQATSSINGFSAAWSLPADSGTPITAAHYQLCQGGSCGDVRTAASVTGVDGITLPAAGDATLRVWLEDQMGHTDPQRAATIVLTYAPPPAPRDEPQLPPGQQPLVPTLPGCGLQCGTTPTPPTPTPIPVRKASPSMRLTTLLRVGRRVTVGGTVGAHASGRVTVRYRVRIHGRTRALSKRVRIARHRFRTTLTLSSALAAARTATVSVAYPGDSDTVPQTRTATVHARA
jgi:hypothetical protein